MIFRARMTYCRLHKSYIHIETFLMFFKIGGVLVVLRHVLEKCQQILLCYLGVSETPIPPLETNSLCTQCLCVREG